jgi:hypothetical protein
MALFALPFAIPIAAQIYVLATVITNVLQSVEVLSYTDGSSRGRWSYSWAGNEDIKMQERLDSKLPVCGFCGSHVYSEVFLGMNYILYHPSND